MSQTALDAGLARLGLDLTVPARDALLAFSDLLLKWNRTYNLTAIRDPQQALAHHILDSLAILPWVGEGPCSTWAAAAACRVFPWPSPGRPWRLPWSMRWDKKTSFQRQAVIELGLGNVVALHGRVETLSGSFSQIVSRAFSDLAAFVGVTRHLLAPGGVGWP